MRRSRYREEQIIGILKEHRGVASRRALPQVRGQRRDVLQVADPSTAVEVQTPGS